jgi:hypothetical protein
MMGRDGSGKEARGSFLKKRTKKLLVLLCEAVGTAVAFLKCWKIVDAGIRLHGGVRRPRVGVQRRFVLRVRVRKHSWFRFSQWPSNRTAQICKSFLLLFFKKEALACAPS